MRKSIIGIMGIIFLCLIFPTTSLGVDDDRETALEYMNTIREHLGIRTLEQNQKLEDSATLHSKYMAANDSFSTFEENGNDYYRGRYSFDRASYNYYINPYVTEYIHNDITSMTDGVRDFIYNPYSRVTFLDPLYEHIGMGYYKDMYTYDLGGQSRSIEGGKILAIFPYDGMEDVPTTWENNYRIDPYRGLVEEGEAVALPITISYYAEDTKVRYMSVSNLQLIENTTGEAIETQVILPQDDKYLTNTVVILPMEALKDNRTYNLTVDISYIFRADRIDQEDHVDIVFSTLKTDNFMTRGEFVEQLVKDLSLTMKEPKKRYKDIRTVSTIAAPIETAYANNLIKGYTDHTFRPYNYITKEQVYTVLIRALETKKGKDYVGDQKEYSSLANMSNWARPYIEKAYEAGLIQSEIPANYTSHMTQGEYKSIMDTFKSLYH